MNNCYCCGNTATDSSMLHGVLTSAFVEAVHKKDKEVCKECAKAYSKKFNKRLKLYKTHSKYYPIHGCELPQTVCRFVYDGHTSYETMSLSITQYGKYSEMFDIGYIKRIRDNAEYGYDEHVIITLDKLFKNTEFENMATEATLQANSDINYDFYYGDTRADSPTPDQQETIVLDFIDNHPIDSEYVMSNIALQLIESKVKSFDSSDVKYGMFRTNLSLRNQALTYSGLTHTAEQKMIDELEEIFKKYLDGKPNYNGYSEPLVA